MKLLVVNGVNLNMLGIREVNLYGKQDFSALKKYIRKCAAEKNIKVKLYQSNSESRIVTKIQKALGKYDGIIINAGAYTHTSVAILDALKAVSIKTVEVHLTDISEREDFRKFSFISLYAEKVIKGLGFEGYRKAIDYFAEQDKPC